MDSVGPTSAKVEVVCGWGVPPCSREFPAAIIVVEDAPDTPL